MKNFSDIRLIWKSRTLYNWKVCKVNWPDFKVDLGKLEGIQLESGGLLRPLTKDKLIYRTPSGKVLTLPAKGGKMLLPILEAFDKDERLEIELNEVNKYVRLYRKIKDKFSRK